MRDMNTGVKSHNNERHQNEFNFNINKIIIQQQEISINIFCQELYTIQIIQGKKSIERTWPSVTVGNRWGETKHGNLSIVLSTHSNQLVILYFFQFIQQINENKDT